MREIHMAHKIRKARTVAALIATTILLLTGCDQDARLTTLAEESARQQAGQNQEMARLHHEVAEGARQLVEADAKARQGVLAMQQQLQERQAEVGQQRDQLESERREIARQRLSESVFGPILAELGPLAVCGLVLVLCGLLIYGLRSGPSDADTMGEILIEELVSPRPMLYSPILPQVATDIFEDDGRQPAAIADQTGPPHEGPQRS